MIRLVAPERVPVTDSLRPPSPLDLLARAYKDWLHLNVFVPEHGIAVVLNASLHGDPLVGSSLGVGTFVVTRENESVIAAVDVRSQSAVDRRAAAIGVGSTARLALAEHGWFIAASGRAGDTALDVVGTPTAEPIEVGSPVRFGSGWISWRAMPRLRIDGTLRVAGQEVELDSAIGYHDHNWGRWCWGDDIGWRWGVFPVPTDEVGRDISVVVAHRTDRCHRRGRPVARLQVGSLLRDYAERTVSVTYVGRSEARLLRLPGAMAALRSDRQQPDLPHRVIVRIDDGFDRVTIEFSVDEAVQLVTCEPTRPGHTFIHELTGRFALSGVVGSRPVAGEGLGVFEHVD